MAIKQMVLVLAALLVCGAAAPQAQGLGVEGAVLVGVDDPNISWDASGAITVTASSAHAERPAVNVVNGSGIAYGINLSGHEDIVHSREVTDMWQSDDFDASAANPIPAGTVGGKHWIHFAFDRVYNMNQMWVWNYAEDNYGNYGMKGVTVEYSAQENPGDGDWLTVFAGNFGLTTGAAASGFPTHHDTTILFGGAAVRHVVITSTETGWNFYPGFLNIQEVGLSEVQFYAAPPPATCQEMIQQGYRYPMDVNGDCRVDLLDVAYLAAGWLECMDPEDPACHHPWDSPGN